jgi:hypothetical protein
MGCNRKRGIFCFTILLTFSVATCFGQTWDEFWKQKKTQQKYLLQQIAALQIYTDYLKKGYKIVSTGLTTVRDFSNGEFSLHSAFISSLKTVNPEIQNIPQIAEIMHMRNSINKAFDLLQGMSGLNESNQEYIMDVHVKIETECDKDMDELLLVLTSGKIEMTDSDRITRINKVYEAMKDKCEFTQGFVNKVFLVGNQRQYEFQIINQIKKNYGMDQ